MTDTEEEIVIRSDGENTVGKQQKYDDIIAMQAVVCIAAALGFVVLNLVRPQLCGELISLLKTYTESGKELFPNPIDLIAKL